MYKLHVHPETLIDGFVITDYDSKHPSYVAMQRPAICLENPYAPLENLSRTNVANSQPVYINSNNSTSHKKEEPLNYYNDFEKDEHTETNEYSEIYTADTRVETHDVCSNLLKSNTRMLFLNNDSRHRLLTSD